MLLDHSGPCPPQTDSFCRGVCPTLSEWNRVEYNRLKLTRFAEEFAPYRAEIHTETDRLKLTRFAEEFAVQKIKNKFCGRRLKLTRFAEEFAER